MWLLIAFIAVPLIEIGLFIQVGGFIGMWPTLLIVLLTAVAGSYLVRNQGLREIANLQRSFSELRDPTEPLAHGAMILFSGALLLTPGFFTDVVGLSLLIPNVRKAVLAWARTRVTTASFSTQNRSQPHQHPNDTTIDADYQDVTAQKDPNNHPSGWTRD